jgi:hypothetical protein
VSDLEASRRTLVRAGVWTVPTVSVVTAAPALAAGSALRLDASGSFWVKDWTAYDGSYGVVPQLTVTNGTSLGAGTLTLTLVFPVSAFVGTITTTDPPSPSLVNLSALTNDSWAVTTPAPHRGDTDVRIIFVSTRSLAPGDHLTLEDSQGRDNPGSICWADNPTGDVVPFTVTASAPGFGVVSGGLVRKA